METITKKELDEILVEHKKWCDNMSFLALRTLWSNFAHSSIPILNPNEGYRANLSDAIIHFANLSDAIIHFANDSRGIRKRRTVTVVDRKSLGYLGNQHAEPLGQESRV